jgi:hypothetical protein
VSEGGAVAEGLTKGDGVDLALHLDGGVVAVKDVDHLLQFSLLDQQVVSLLKVLLERRSRGEDSQGSPTTQDGCLPSILGNLNRDYI